jgi:DNA polymerase I-like protein with 3'-5' exonuclease and polymerase domains
VQLGWSIRNVAYIRLRLPGGVWAFDAPEAAVGDALRSLLNRPEVRYIGHNVSEDLLWLEHKFGIETYDRVEFDTMYAAHLCNENEPVGLERLSVRYTPYGRYDVPLMLEIKEKEIDVEETGYLEISDEVLIPYACKDADVVMMCEPILKERLIREGVAMLYYEEVVPVSSNVALELKRNGLPVDMDRVEQLTHIYNNKLVEMVLRLQLDLFADAAERLFRKASDLAIPSAALSAILTTKFLTDGKIQLARSRLELAVEKSQTPEDLHDVLVKMSLDPVIVDIRDTVPYVELEKLVKSSGIAIEKWSAMEPFMIHFRDARNFNLNATEQISRFLFQILNLVPIKTTGKPSMSWAKVLTLDADKQAQYTPSSDNQTLEILRDESDLVDSIWKAKRVANIVKVFLREDKEGIHKHVYSDGRLYYDISFLTETGRGRTWSPNVQNWPKRADATMVEIFGKDKLPPSIRSCIIAPKGYHLLEIDYQSAELFVMAYLSNDPNMLGALTQDDPNYVIVDIDGKKKAKRSNKLTAEEVAKVAYDSQRQPLRPKRDLHWEMAEDVANKLREELNKDKDRVGAKSGNFGIPYGMTPPTLARKIRADTGQPYTQEQAEAFIQGHMKRFARLHEYFAEQERIIQNDICGGVSINAFGRKRRFFLGENFLELSNRQKNSLTNSRGRESRNFPIQSYVADAINVASVLFLRMRQQMKFGTKILLILHDALLLAVPDNELEMIRKVVEFCMCDATVKQVPGGLFRLGVDMDTFKRWTEKEKHK